MHQLIFVYVSFCYKTGPKTEEYKAKGNKSKLQNFIIKHIRLSHDQQKRKKKKKKQMYC